MLHQAAMSTSAAPQQKDKLICKYAPTPLVVICAETESASLVGGFSETWPPPQRQTATEDCRRHQAAPYLCSMSRGGEGKQKNSHPQKLIISTVLYFKLMPSDEESHPLTLTPHSFSLHGGRRGRGSNAQSLQETTAPPPPPPPQTRPRKHNKRHNSRSRASRAPLCLPAPSPNSTNGSAPLYSRTSSRKP